MVTSISETICKGDGTKGVGITCGSAGGLDGKCLAGSIAGILGVGNMLTAIFSWWESRSGFVQYQNNDISSGLLSDDFIRLPTVENLRKFQVTDDIISRYLSAKSGQACKQALMHRVDWQY